MIKSRKIKKESFFPAEKFATISVVNSSTVVSDDEIKAAIPDFQAAIDEDFTPFWAANAKLQFIPKGQAPPPRSWWISLMDNSDVQDADISTGFFNPTSGHPDQQDIEKYTSTV